MSFFAYFFVQLESLLRYMLVYEGVLGFKRTKKKTNYVFVLGIVVIMSGLSYFGRFEQASDAIAVIINPIIFYALFLGKRTVRIFTYIPLFLCFNFIDELVAIISGYLFDFNPLIIIQVDYFWINAIIMMPSIIIITIICFLNKRRQQFYNIQDYVTLKEYIIIIVALFCLVMLMTIISYGYFFEDEQKMLSNMNIVLLFLIATVLILLLLMTYTGSLIVAKKTKAELLKMYEKKDTLQNDYYQMLYRKNEEIKDFRHDYRYHVNYIYRQLENKNYEKTEEYLKSLIEVGKNVLGKKQLYSGNSVIDAVICGVMEDKKAEGIDFSYRGKVSPKLKIEEIDLTTILYNALENAVEACGYCKEKKEIHMELRIFKGNIIINIDNTYNESLTKYNGEYVTCKKDKDFHGRGIQNMKRVVQKYEGSLKCEENNSVFSLKIQLNEKDDE